jgi:hypothetical protein
MVLAPVQMPGPVEEREPGWDSPIVACEACGKQEKRHLMINAVICIPAPGHPALTGFGCPAGEHWACSPECWRTVAHACIDEHMHELLKAHLRNIGS